MVIERGGRWRERERRKKESRGGMGECMIDIYLEKTLKKGNGEIERGSERKMKRMKKEDGGRERE